MAHNAFEAFVITPLVHVRAGGYDAAFTNSALAILLGIIISVVFYHIALRKPTLVPGRLQFVAESSYLMVRDALDRLIGPKGRTYIPLILTVFLFILFGNFEGFAPGGFSYTSHIVLTFAVAFALFLFNVVLGLVRKGWYFFALFLPPGLPKPFIPVIFLLELFSYFIRPMTLSIRLTANITVGHLLLGTVGSFVVTLGILFGVLPFILLFPLVALELLVSFIQAYVFMLLSCIYLNDSLKESHD